MNPLETLLAKLPGAKKVGDGWAARCPAHDDRRASLSIRQGDDSAALVKCHAGCDTAAVLSAVGLTLADLFPRTPGPAPNRNGKPTAGGRVFATADEAVAELERRHGKRSALWTYRDPQGKPVGVVVRWDNPDGKDIRPAARHAGGWRIGAMPEPRPLYGLPGLAAAKRVVVCEGEKASDAARSLGFVATTSAGGSQAAGKTDWRPLAGKEVWIMPDNDAPGRKYADTVASILAKLAPAPTLRVVELPELPEGGDIVDWIDAHGDAAEPDAMRAEIEALAHTVEPRNAADADDLAFRPFPVDALPKPIRGFVAAGARAIGCDPSYLALPLLTATAAAVGNTRRLELKRGWSAPPILWGAIVGESGTAKTPAFKLVMRPIHERQRKALERHAEAMKQHEAALARYERDATAWKQANKTDAEPPPKPEPAPCERFVVSDITVEALAPVSLANPRGVLLARDELAGWIGSFDRYGGKGKGGADSASWLSMFNAESVIVDRKTGIPRTIHVPQAAVCVCGGIQPATLRRALGREHRESGLAARLLLAYPPRKAKRWTEDDIDPDTEEELARLFDRLYGLRPAAEGEGGARPVLVRLSDDAKSAWKAYYNAHAAEQVDLTGDMAAAWSKLEEYAARLALVIHFVRWAAGDIAEETCLDVASMNAGIALAKWFKHEARRVYSMLEESDADGDQRRLVEWICRKDRTVTAREVQQGCRWLKQPGAAEAALEELAKAGRGTWRDLPTTAKGGRPAWAFALSTPSTVYDTPTKPDESGGSVDVDGVDAGEVGSPASPGQGGLFGGPTPAGPYRDGF
jgi:hypothetical protein